MRSAGRADASKFINEDGKCGPPGRGPPSLGNLETTLLRGRRPRPRRLLGGQPSTPETEGKRKCEATSGPLIIPPGLESGALYVLGPRPQTRGCPHTLHPTPFRAGTSAAPTARRRPLVKPFTRPAPHRLGHRAHRCGRRRESGPITVKVRICCRGAGSAGWGRGEGEGLGQHKPPVTETGRGRAVPRSERRRQHCGHCGPAGGRRLAGNRFARSLDAWSLCCTPGTHLIVQLSLTNKQQNKYFIKNFHATKNKSASKYQNCSFTKTLFKNNLLAWRA